MKQLFLPCQAWFKFTTQTFKFVRWQISSNLLGLGWGLHFGIGIGIGVGIWGGMTLVGWDWRCPRGGNKAMYKTGVTHHLIPRGKQNLNCANTYSVGTGSMTT